MTSTPKVIAALGSSYAAGPGIAPVVNTGAMRSGANYAHLLADRLGARLVDLSVSGATTSTIVNQRQRMLFRTFDPQIDGLPSDADLVTITAGGNDLKYASSMLSASVASILEGKVITRVLARLLRRRPAPTPTPGDISRTAAGLVSVVVAVQAKAPQARVILVDYLTGVAPYTVPGTDAPFTAREVAVFTSMQSAIREAFVSAARDTGADLVEASMLSADHGLGSSEQWVFGFRGFRNLASSFHPNPAGMQAIADELYKRVTHD